jgi:PAS domain S-box-containing protein
MLPDTPRVRSRLDLLYAVTREFNAGLDIDQVLNRILSATLATVGVSDGSLFLFDEEGDLEYFLLIDNFEVQQRERPNLEALLHNGLVKWVKEHRTGTLVKDTATDDRWYRKSINSQLPDARSAIAMPVQLPDQLIGIVTLTARRPDFFRQDDLTMLTILADQAAFAISNARLFEAEQRRRRLADTLASIARTINSTLDLNKVLDLILEQLALVVDYDSSSIMLYDDLEETLSVRAARRFEDMDDALSVVIAVHEDTPNYRAIQQKKPIVIGDVDAEPDWIKSSSTEKVRSWIGAPLIAQDQVIGMLTVDSHQLNKYSKENVKEVAAFADQAATAVANAQIVSRLQSAESNYTALFEDSTDLIVITTYQGLILNVNRTACQILRRPKDALIGGDINFVHPRLSYYMEQYAPRLKLWREVSLELEVLDSYRQTISLEFKARQVHYAGRDCVQWVGRDISSRKEAEKLRQDLLNMVIHDLRGPIGNLINTIELLPMILTSTDDPTTIDRLLDLAMQTSQEVKDLVDSMLDVSRLEQGEVPLQPDMISIEDLVAAVEKQVTARAESKEIELTIDPLPEMPPVWLDSNMIRRVLVNLLDNGIKYTPHQGQVSLTTAFSEDRLIFVVSDNGPGISKADQRQIFNKFSRVDYSSNAPSGVGLGLAFCKLAAEAHNGSISVQSAGVAGQGSTFTLSLPLILEPPR